MSAVSGWIVGVLGIIILSILVDLILPEGKTSGFIKNIFGYLIIIVIISPVFSFLTNSKFDLENIFKVDNVQIQDDFVSNVNRQMLDSIEKNIERECGDIGILNVEVGISADIFSSEVTIKQVSVDIKNVVIQGNLQHTNIKNKVVDIVLKNILVDKEQIVFYE